MADGHDDRVAWHRRLSIKHMALVGGVILFVLASFYLQAMGGFREHFLAQRVSAAHVLASWLSRADGGPGSATRGQRLFDRIGVRAVALNPENPQGKWFVADRGMPQDIAASENITNRSPLQRTWAAIGTLRRSGSGVIEVRGRPVGADDATIAILIGEQRLFNAMMRTTARYWTISLAIAAMMGSILYISLYRGMIQPIDRLNASMVAFRRRPDDPKSAIKPSDRRDEIGHAEHELARMQEELRGALSQRRRLALLGQAVSKVNHDLRNILATAQLSLERLSAIDDPQARGALDRIVRAIDRAISLCERTLAYGRSDEPLPDKRDLAVRPVVDDVIGSVAGSPDVRWVNSVPETVRVYADPEHLYRILLNLARNAATVLDNQGGGGDISVSGERTPSGATTLFFADTGPGLPKKAQDNLFVPFAGGSGNGGTGLGLTIVYELMVAHGGEAALEKSDATGTTFRLSFPSA